MYDLVSGKDAKRAPVARLSRVLSLGIGHGVHRGLLDGMAGRCDGAAVYVVDDEAIAPKTAFLRRAALAAGAALRPRLRAAGALVRPAPHVLPQRLFPGEPLHVRRGAGVCAGAAATCVESPLRPNGCVAVAHVIASPAFFLQVLLEVVSCEPDAELELTADYPAGPDGVAPAPLTLRLPLGAVVAGGAAVPEGHALPVLHAMAYIGSLLVSEVFQGTACNSRSRLANLLAGSCAAVRLLSQPSAVTRPPRSPAPARCTCIPTAPRRRLLPRPTRSARLWCGWRWRSSW